MQRTPTTSSGDGERIANQEAVPLERGRFESTCLALLEQTTLSQAHLAQQLEDLANQNTLLRQQVGQLYAAVGHQCQQLLQSDTALQQELKKYQTAGPQRAMAGIVNKLFRDLLQHLTHLDELVSVGEKGTHQENETPWINAIRVSRDQVEAILRSWGCEPLIIELARTAFDAELHESVLPEVGDVPPGTPGNVIVKVRRRGWRLHESVLQYAQVVVS